MTEILVGMLIGAILGSLLTAVYLGICLKEEEESSGNWIDQAIASAFAEVEHSVLEDLRPQL